MSFKWLWQSLALVDSDKEMRKDRILVDEIPSNRNYLTSIIEAMKNNHVVTLTYRSFIHGTFHTFSAEPYCLKMFQKRWYLLARNLDDNCLRIYGLDRMEDMEETKEHFTMPKNFDAHTYFLTSSSCHPKIFVKEFSYFLMPCHQHGLGVNLLVQR